MDSGKKESMTTQIHQIYIRGTPEAIWSALTRPEWTSQYGYRARATYDLKPGGAYQSQSNAQADWLARLGIRLVPSQSPDVYPG